MRGPRPAVPVNERADTGRRGAKREAVGVCRLPMVYTGDINKRVLRGMDINRVCSRLDFTGSVALSLLRPERHLCLQAPE